MAFTQQSIVIDGVVGVAIAIAAGLSVSTGSLPTAFIGWTLALVLGAQVLLRRPAPRVALWGGMALTALSVLVGMRADVAMAALALVLYTVALQRSSGRRAIGLVLPLLAVPINGMFAPWMPLSFSNAETPWSLASDPLGNLLYGWLLLAASWLLGRTVKHMRENKEEIRLLREAELLSEERLRIAREVHDGVGHRLALIAAHASITNYVAEVHPEQTRTALDNIAAISREALADIRAVVSQRHESATAIDEMFRQPIENSQAAGLSVTAHIDISPDISDTVRVAGSRILQEALTNSMRHAHERTQCEVRVETSKKELVVSIVDTGPARSTRTGDGSGLTGIRNRVDELGGTVVVGPRDDGGFQVHARLPLEETVAHG